VVVEVFVLVDVPAMLSFVDCELGFPFVSTSGFEGGVVVEEVVVDVEVLVDVLSFVDCEIEFPFELTSGLVGVDYVALGIKVVVLVDMFALLSDKDYEFLFSFVLTSSGLEGGVIGVD